jgi:group I intron endonuclease
MKLSGIYKICSRAYPNRVYIGSAVDIKDRWRYHLKDCKNGRHKNGKIINHYNKYGKDDFVFSILAICEREELFPINGIIWIEQVFIDAYKPFFNINPKAGSNMGRHASDKTRLKQKESALKRLPHTEESLKKQSESMKGKNTGKRPQWIVDKISNSLKGHIPWNKGKKGIMPVPWNKGLTKETNEKIAKGTEKMAKKKKGQPTWNKGVSATPEHVQKLKDAWIIRKQRAA